MPYIELKERSIPSPACYPKNSWGYLDVYCKEFNKKRRLKESPVFDNIKLVSTPTSEAVVVRDNNMATICEIINWRVAYPKVGNDIRGEIGITDDMLGCRSFVKNWNEKDYPVEKKDCLLPMEHVNALYFDGLFNGAVPFMNDPQLRTKLEGMLDGEKFCSI